MTTKPGPEEDAALRIFVTVGTTRFDSLIRAVLSTRFLESISELARRSPNETLKRTQLIVQYGNSSIADILTSSSLAMPDQGSEIVPEPGLREINGRRVFQSGTKILALDPGQTGTIPGLRLRAPTQSSELESTISRTSPQGQDPREIGKSVFDTILQEAKATAGLSPNLTSSSLQGAQVDLLTQNGVELHMFQFAPDLKPYIESAHVVVSHAGSGTILDTLRAKPVAPALVVVPNTSLMDNHQVELAQALARDKYLVAGSEESLGRDVARARTTPCEPFPDFDPSRFTRIVDEATQF